jgi:hypothetical protein
MKAVMSTVLRMTQSPLNKHRWSLDLSCGHETWITTTRRPTRVKLRCFKCEEVGNGEHGNRVVRSHVQSVGRV